MVESGLLPKNTKLSSSSEFTRLVSLGRVCMTLRRLSSAVFWAFPEKEKQQKRKGRNKKYLDTG
jgi:hypothetical protein